MLIKILVLCLLLVTGIMDYCLIYAIESGGFTVNFEMQEGGNLQSVWEEETIQSQPMDELLTEPISEPSVDSLEEAPGISYSEEMLFSDQVSPVMEPTQIPIQSMPAEPQGETIQRNIEVPTEDKIENPDAMPEAFTEQLEPTPEIPIVESEKTENPYLKISGKREKQMFRINLESSDSIKLMSVRVNGKECSWRWEKNAIYLLPVSIYKEKINQIQCLIYMPDKGMIKKELKNL